MNIKLWVLNKLVTPVLPVLKQVIYVIDVVNAKIDSVISSLEVLGIKLDGTVLSNIQNILSAISVVRVALVKVLEFLGVTFEIETKNNIILEQVDLTREIEKLKKMI